MSTTVQTIVVDDEDDYLRLASEVDGVVRPLPILRGTDGTVADPLSYPTTARPDSRHWRGTVWYRDPSRAAAARVLARATGRSLHHGEVDEAIQASRTAPVTLFAEPGTLDPARLATIPHDARLGLLVAHDLPATTALVARTVLHGPAVLKALKDLAFDTVPENEPPPEWLTGAAVTPTRLRSALGAGVAVLVGRGHARDCLIHLNGGGICGRRHEKPLLTVQPAVDAAGWAEHPTACQQGPGCYRDDVEVGDHLRGADVRAAFVVLDSCRIAVAGGGRIRADVSIPLSLLDGHALAVCCGLGVRRGAAHAGHLFRALLHGGASLGEALSESNGAIAADPAAMGRLTLFGDAGLVPKPVDQVPAPLENRDGLDVAAGDGAVLVAGTGLLAEDAGGPLVVPRATGSSSWVLTADYGRSGGRIGSAPERLDGRWTQRVRPWLDRLRGLAGLGLDVSTADVDAAHRMAAGAVRARARAEDLTSARGADAAFAEAERTLAELQFRLVDKEIRWASRTFYSFAAGWPEPWHAEDEGETIRCPQCADLSGARHRVRSASGVGPELLYEICARCGEVESGLAAFPAEVLVRGPAAVRGGDPIRVEVSIESRAGWPLDIAIGTAFVHEERLHCRMLDSRSLTLGPGDRTTAEFAGTSDPDLTVPDAQFFKVLLAVDGAVRCLTRAVVIRSQTA